MPRKSFSDKTQVGLLGRWFARSVAKLPPPPPALDPVPGQWTSPVQPSPVGFYHLVIRGSLEWQSVHSFVRSFVRSFFRSLVCSLARSFAHSFVRSFARSFVHSLGMKQAVGTPPHLISPRPRDKCGVVREKQTFLHGPHVCLNGSERGYAWNRVLRA